MAVAIIVIIIVVLAVAVVAGSAWRRSHKPVAPGAPHGMVSPGPAPEGGPGFTPVAPTGSFTVVSSTKNATPPPSGWAASGTRTTFGTVYRNPTATCRLTGMKMADCTCDKCTKEKEEV